eukprot:TRINITY_DN2416_c0_g1_i1.p1 TRINITY_DN2416_c0_g1~~TRINITY_DN2416_c0_g1_i1.p1  ORF type:complete len:831 (-),score=256.75 TRINITY_DN2416_c0_g1_i1:39-2456(-)
MLPLERRKTEKVDIAKPLEAFIKNQYSAQAAQDHLEALNNFQQMREDVRNIQDRNDATKDLLYRYYGTLQSVELRFPIGENHVRISFPWYDSFKNRKTALFSIHFEKTSILYNIGVTLAQMGTLQNRTTSDGLKAACQNFQQAAGVFELLKEELEKHPQPNVPDLSTECINMYINLMLGQAQECFAEKALKDNMNPSIVAKLAAQASSFYETAGNVLSSPVLSAVIPKHWPAQVGLRAAVQKASSEMSYATAMGKNDEYGQQVGRLHNAVFILEEAKKKHKSYFTSVPADLQQLFATQQANAARLLQAAEKENDTIYHETVPQIGALASIEGKAMVKPTPVSLESLMLPSDRDPFRNLVPFAVTEKLSIYQERKDQLLRDDFRQIEELNQLAIGSLSSMNLPGAIEALESPSGVPAPLLEKMKTVKSEGGARLILDFVDTLNKLAEEDQNLLNQSAKILDDEEQDDEAMRSQYSQRWSRTPSHTLTANLRQELAKFRGNIDHARKSDGYVLKKFQEHQQYVVKLTGSPQDIQGMIPSGNAPVGSNPYANALKQSLALLDRMIAQRATLKTELSNLASRDDPTAKLLANIGVTGDEEVYASELEKYTPLQSQLRQTFDEQGSLLDRIVQENAAFVESKNGDRSGAEREAIMQQLNTAFKVYTDLKSNLREGIQFYTNFQEILRQFMRKCEDFAFARKTEKTDLVREIQHQSSAMPQQYPPQHGGYPPQQGYPQPPSGAYPGGYAQPPPTNYYPQYGAQQGYPPQQPQPPQGQPPQGIPGGWQPNMQPVYQQPGQFQPGYNPYPPKR